MPVTNAINSEGATSLGAFAAALNVQGITAPRGSSKTWCFIAKRDRFAAVIITAAYDVGFFI